jgi:MYXO-CTERM domain-containing protein
MTWLAFGLLVACVVTALWPRRYHRNHPRAGRSYCYPVFGLLAGSLAMFVLLTHWYDVFVWAAVTFWVLWLGGLIAAIASKKSDGFWPAFLMSALGWILILLPVGSTVFHFAPTPPPASASQNVGGQEALDKAPAGTGTAPKTCDAKFKQEWQQNPDFRVIDGGLYEDVAHKKITPAQADKKQREIAGHDVRALAGYAYAEGLRDNANYTDLLTHDKKCLATQGVALYEKLIKKWDSGKVSIAQASADATNSGMENGKLVVNSTSGITGDKTALRRTYPDGSKTDTLARCGNSVFKTKPKHIPPGKTDEHPPKETPPPTSITTPPTSTPPTTTPPTTTPPTTTPPTTTPPTTTPPTTTPPTTTPPTTTPPETCPPGQTGTPPDCLQTKDPDDNHHDDGDNGKPPATTEGPVDTATPVETQPADPTDQPGDEATDEPADGATHQPTAEPTQPPATGAPTDDEPGGTPTDPDGNAVAGMFAAPLLGLGALWRRRRLGL